MGNKPSPLETIDEYISAIQTGENRYIVVYKRQHGGREYLRWRTWHKHRTKGVWYPDKRRGGVLPLDAAEALGAAFAAAPAGKAITPPPDWLRAKVERIDERIAHLEWLNAPDSLLRTLRRQRNELIGRE